MTTILKQLRAILACTLVPGLLSSTAALAQEQGSPAPEPSAAAVAESGPVDLQVGLSWSLGSTGNTTGSIQSRTINVLAFKFFPNYDLSTHISSLPFKLVAGPFAEFRFIGQNTDPLSVSNTNVRGTGYLVGLGLGVELEEYSFIASLDLAGAHNLNNRIPTDQVSDFTGAFGTRLVAGYMVRHDLSVDLVLSFTRFSNNNIVGDLGGNPLGQTTYGLGARYFLDI